uniref:Uncharacterized protein n=1 Tax=Cacopsylla melanoneura TaxID=428564 RepID=A0A8D8ZMB5_9HEMI
MSGNIQLVLMLVDEDIFFATYLLPFWLSNPTPLSHSQIQTNENPHFFISDSLLSTLSLMQNNNYVICVPWSKVIQNNIHCPPVTHSSMLITISNVIFMLKRHKTQNN